MGKWVGPVLVSLLGAAALAGCGSDSTPDLNAGSGGSDSAGQAQDIAYRFGSVNERNLDIDPDGANTTAAIEAMNAFAVDLFSEVADPNANTVISPYSAVFALGMIYAGAGGATAQEMGAVLHADSSGHDWHEGINAYDLSLDGRTVDSPTEWNSASKVWAQPGVGLLDSYLDTLTGEYGSPLAEVNFGESEAARELINGWVAGQTKQRVPELWPPNSFSAQTKVVLVNAVALDAPWEFPFDPAQTSPQPFTLADGSTVDTDMMRYDEFLPTAEGVGWSAVEIPYAGGALSMVAIVPDDLGEFESQLTPEGLDGIVRSISAGGVHLQIPKWSARTHLTLNQHLTNMGMPSAFGPNADFSNMATSALRLARVEHEAFVEVDEAGTRAAAATGGMMEGSHGPTVDLNRPFFYVISDRGAGTILFMGHVVNPTIAA